MKKGKRERNNTNLGEEIDFFASIIVVKLVRKDKRREVGHC